jgi:hypothetical protein
MVCRVVDPKGHPHEADATGVVSDVERAPVVVTTGAGTLTPRPR